MSSLPKVLVIMSTYNGEKFLREQIDSILAQENVSVTLHVSDDCSKDKTVDIVKEYQTKHKNIELYVNEKNKNFTYNFLDALFRFKDCKDYDYYAFADQDDYWLPNKLQTAITQIKATGECTLYCANLKIVDSNLRYAGKNMRSTDFHLQHQDLFCSNIATGCTFVMDSKFKDLATQHYPQNIYLHDYWLAVIANFCQTANLVYDSNPSYILYRQHSNNQIGKNFLKAAKKFLFHKVPPERKISHLMNEFYTLYSNMVAASDVPFFEHIRALPARHGRKFLIKNVKSQFKAKLKLKLFLRKY